MTHRLSTSVKHRKVHWNRDIFRNTSPLLPQNTAKYTHDTHALHFCKTLQSTSTTHKPSTSAKHRKVYPWHTSPPLLQNTTKYIHNTRALHFCKTQQSTLVTQTTHLYIAAHHLCKILHQSSCELVRMCTYTRMRVCICVCEHVYMRVCERVCERMCGHLGVCHLHVHVCLCVYLCTSGTCRCLLGAHGHAAMPGLAETWNKHHPSAVFSLSLCTLLSHLPPPCSQTSTTTTNYL